MCFQDPDRRLLVPRVQARRDQSSLVDCKPLLFCQNKANHQGVWFNRGLGSHALSQPAREFIVKTIEMGLYSADFLTCHRESILAFIRLD